MNEAVKRFQSILRIPLLVTFSTILMLLGLFAYSPYGVVFYVLIIAPIVGLTLLWLLVTAAEARKMRKLLKVLLTAAGLTVVSWLLVRNESVLRPELRWLLWSRHYKEELLAQRDTGSGFRHLEWDSWGFVPSGNNTVYLVYDPSDSLAAVTGAREPLKVSGIPCAVPSIHRLEKQWYSVLFYTDEQWENCQSAE